MTRRIQKAQHTLRPRVVALLQLSGWPAYVHQLDPPVAEAAPAASPSPSPVAEAAASDERVGPGKQEPDGGSYLHPAVSHPLGLPFKAIHLSLSRRKEDIVFFFMYSRFLLKKKKIETLLLFRTKQVSSPAVGV